MQRVIHWVTKNFILKRKKYHVFPSSLVDENEK